MNYVLDAHSHTLASGHAYSTIAEMAISAKEKGLELLCITEHAPTMPSTCGMYYFMNYRIFDRGAYAVPLRMGVELNILDEKGTIDMPEEILEIMDFRIASLHPPCTEIRTQKDCTNAIIQALKNPFIDLIGHPDDSRFPLDYKEVVLAAKQFHKILEVNNSSLLPTSYRPGARDNYKKMLEYCATFEVPVLANSDAHMHPYVGLHDETYRLLEELHFPEELILNTSVEKFEHRLKR